MLNKETCQVNLNNQQLLNCAVIPLDDKLILESISSAVLITDLDANIFVFNKAAEEMFDIKRSEAIGTKYYAGVSKAEEQRLQKVFHHVVRTGKTFCSQDVIFMTPRGKKLILNPHVFLIKDQMGTPTGIGMIVEDVTQKRRMERIVQIKQKMEALGEMAVGIAHELRNPLSSIKGFAVLVKADLPSDSDSHKYLDIITKEADRISRLSEDLLHSARNPEVEKYVPLSINDIVGSAINRFKDDIVYYNAYVEIKTEPDLPLIWGDRGRLEHALMNLLYNAYQALDCNGYICVNTSKDENNVIIAIKDTGKGIEPEIIDSIFNPFYTTRPDGIGLGLALVHSVVTKHWGHIEVESKPGKGAVFTIRLPFREKVKILE